MRQTMENVGKRNSITKSGYLQTSNIYRAKNCNGCPLRGTSYRSKGNNRVVLRNTLLEHYKDKVKSNLLSYRKY
ncbi:transposase [Weeksellaceae bacterium TAE3-ERU29]|nr:transposase [Weeksellaceae bacterium TAE3-ERU29]